MTRFKPVIIGLGGTTRAGSSTERALGFALAAAEAAGAEVELIAGPDLILPMYSPETPERTPEARRIVAALRRAHGVIIASPGYHGSLSGLIKNALDYVEDMRGDAVPYLDGRAVGLIACASGWQATGTTLVALRSIIHALRGWPTPLGVGVNTVGGLLDPAGTIADPAIAAQLTLLGQQVVDFSQHRNAFLSGRNLLSATAPEKEAPGVISQSRISDHVALP